MSESQKRRKRQRNAPVLSAHWRMRNRMPKIDTDENPFCVERQIADQQVQIRRNRNPRKYDANSGETTRSITFNKTSKLEDELDVFKYRVLSQAMLDIEDTPEDGSASKVLSPPQVREHGWMFGDSDVATTTSFGHRPKSASRTFNPLSMKVEPVQQHKSSKSKVFMTTTVLYNLLHPPPVSVSEEPSTSLSLTLTSRGMARSSREEQEEASEGRSEVGPEVSTPPTDASQSSQLELGWDNKFHTYRRKFFSDVSSLLSGANWSSVEKLKRFQKRSAGIDIPELYKGRYERDLNYMKDISGTFFPRTEPELIGKAPMTPRTVECNRYIRSVLEKEQQKKERLEEKVRKYKYRLELDRIPKLPPLQI